MERYIKELEYLKLLKEERAQPASSHELTLYLCCKNNLHYGLPLARGIHSSTCEGEEEIKGEDGANLEENEGLQIKSEWEDDENAKEIGKTLVKLISPDAFFEEVLPKLRSFAMKQVTLTTSKSRLTSWIDLRKADLQSLVITESVEECEQDLQDTLKKLEKLNKLNSSVKLLSSVIPIREKLENIRCERTTMEKELQNYSTLKDLLRKAKHESLNELVQLINDKLSHKLGDFLGNELSVKLSVEKKLKSVSKTAVENGVADNKAEVHLDVFRRGVRVCQMSSLSGGEKEKIRSMMSLCVQDMLNQKLLILDESLSTLDEDATETVIRKLGHCANGLVVVVNHRHSSDLYLRNVDISNCIELD